MRFNSYIRALTSLVVFVIAFAVFGLVGTPNQPTTLQPKPVPVTNAFISVSPDCSALSTADPRQNGVTASAASGECVVTIDRQQDRFIVVRTQFATSYDRTSPLNTREELVVKVKEGQLGVWVNTLPSSAYDTWQCGFDVAPGSVSDDFCNGQPLPVAVF